MNNYYVYEHWRPDTNQCFYVGKGRGYRAYRRSGRNKHWQNVVHKLERCGLAHEIRIVCNNMTENEAIRLEVERIAFWKGVVRVVNLTEGGEGVSGFVMPAEVRAKLSMMGKGRRLSEETRNKISVSVKNFMTPEKRAKISAATMGKHVSTETRAKLSSAGKGRKAWNSGKTIPLEIRAKISEAVKSSMTPERRLAISVSRAGNIPWNKGQRLSVEHRAKLSAARNKCLVNASPKDKE